MDPTVDRVAAARLRFDEFHTTALCWPTRADQWRRHYQHQSMT